VNRYLGSEFDSFLKNVLPDLGLNWRRHRRRGVRRRVSERMKTLGIRSMAEYQACLARDPKEKNRFLTLLGVTISRFFREAHVFDYLAAEIWPAWSGRKRVVMFSAGCAGGEEPYTLAILWREHGPAGVRPVILAADLDPEALPRARRGVYPPSSLREVPAAIKARYFHPQNGQWSLDEDVKKMVHFYRADLRHSGFPEELDLVLCRNLAYTYFALQAQEETGRAMAKALAAAGLLVVGAKERPKPEMMFEQVYPCVYRLK